MAKILFLFSLLFLLVLIRHSQGALFYFYNFNPAQVQIPPLDKVRYSISLRSSVLTAFCSLSFRNNTSRNQLGWIFCTPGRFLSQNVNVYVYQRCIHQLDTFLSNKHPIVKKFVYNSCRLLFGLTGRIYNRLSLVTHTLRHLPSSSSQLASQRSVGGWVSSPVIYWLLQASGSRDPMLIH